MRNGRRTVGLALCCSALAAPAADAAPRNATVVKVVDGDTLRVKAGGRTVDVDLLGVRAASDCGVDGAATLRALLPRGAKVRLARDGFRAGAYVHRGRTFVNRELLELGVARAGDLDGLRQARRLRAAQRSARSLKLGVWSCEEAAQPGAPVAGAIDTPENRAELDRFVRGHRFTVQIEADGSTLEVVMQFCADGRLIRQYSYGLERGSDTGTWTQREVVRRDDQLFFGRFETNHDEEGETYTDDIGVGRRGDGTPVVGDAEDPMTAKRAPVDAC